MVDVVFSWAYFATGPSIMVYFKLRVVSGGLSISDNVLYDLVNVLSLVRIQLTQVLNQRI